MLGIQVIESTEADEMQRGPCLVSHLVRLLCNQFIIIICEYIYFLDDVNW